jgi:phosphoserine phosphatase
VESGLINRLIGFNLFHSCQAITEAAMNGEIDFKESLRRRVALLAGTSSAALDKVRDSIVFTEGAQSLCRALKRLGYRLAVISGELGLLSVCRNRI